MRHVADIELRPVGLTVSLSLLGLLSFLSWFLSLEEVDLFRQKNRRNMILVGVVFHL